MTAEQIIYTRLAADATLTGIVGANLYPTQPTENSQLPLAVYTITAANAQVHTTGTSALTRFDVIIDAWAITIEEVLAVLTAVKDSMHGQRWSGVQGCFLSSQLTDEQELGQHGQATYSLWANI